MRVDGVIRQVDIETDIPLDVIIDAKTMERLEKSLIEEGKTQFLLDIVHFVQKRVAPSPAPDASIPAPTASSSSSSAPEPTEETNQEPSIQDIVRSQMMIPPTQSVVSQMRTFWQNGGRK